jgi:hypothetical protein
MGMCPETMSCRLDIHRQIGNSWRLAYSSARHNTPQQITDKEVTLSMTDLCNCDDNALIRFSVVSLNGNNMINSVQTNMSSLKNGQTSQNGAAGAMLELSRFEVFTRPSFIDYLRGGIQVSMVCAIDYTASNGAQTLPSSLHAMGPNNQYEKAIWNVGAIIEPYDSDKSFPTFGFGGVPRYMGVNSTSHCFALNGNPSNPDIMGIENIVNTYRQTLPNIGLSGPTYFGPLLQQFTQYVRSMAADNMYQILLLCTDGIIMDMDETKRCIVELSSLPCSIIIVGVGSANFDAMEELDGDDGILRHNGRACERDIVQFVEFNKAVMRGDLAAQVLCEVPKQCMSYYEKVGFKP